MRFLLLRDSPGQTTKLVFQAFDLAPRSFALLAIHLRGASQSPGGAVHIRRRHLQIAQEFGGRRCRSLRFRCRCALKNNAGSSRRRCRITGGPPRQAAYSCRLCRVSQ